MSKKVNAKAASVLLTAAMVGSTVPAPVFAAAADETEDVHVSTLAQGEEGTEDSEITIPETTPGETEDSGSEETGGETDGTEDGRTIIYNGFDSVTMDGSMDLGSFLNEILTMAGFSLPDEASTDQIRLDWVGSDGYRTRLRVGNAEADAAMSVQTLDGLCELASSEANGLSLVVFRDEAGEMLRMVFSVDADGTVRINNQGAVPDGAYIVRFYGNGGTLGKSMNVMRMSGEKLSYIEQTATWDEDHKFLGWFTEAEGGEAVTEDTVVTSNMKVYAQWDATKFTLTFDTQGGDPVESQTVEIGDAVKKLPTPVREGYTFLGWFDAAEGGNPVKSIDAMTGDVTLYAQWEKKEDPTEPTDPDKETFTLTFDAQGGTTVKAQKVEEGAAVTNLPKTEREGYKFLGWFDAAEGGNRVTRINAMSGDMTLYAQWKEKDPTDPEDPEKTVHTVTFDTRGGEEIPAQEVKDGEGLMELPTPVREGYKFLGWFDAAEGGNQVEFLQEVFDDVTLYAQWEAEDPEDPEKQVFTLTFDTQGGETIAPMEVTEGDAVTNLPMPVRDGYEFLGWFDAVENGNQVTAISEMSEDVTLYAHWLKEEEPGDPDNNNPGDNNNGDNTNNGDNNNNNQDPDDNNDNQNNGQNNNGNNNNTNNGQNNNGNNNNNQQEEQTERYALSIISPTGTKTEVGVDSDVTLGALAEKLGYTVSSWGLKTATTEERAADANITMKDIADVAEGSEVLLIAYNADGTAMGSAKVTKTGDGTYQVSLSKDTNVELSEMNGKGKGEGEGEGEENTPTPDTQNPGGSSGTGTGVSNSGKGDSVATSVDTADSLALPVYGGLSALLTTALGALAVIKKKFLK